MTRTLLAFFAFFTFVCLASPAKADHLFGGELYYTHIGGLNYRVTLALYGDCGSISPASFAALNQCAPQILVKDNQSVVLTTNLAFEQSSGNEISPVCPSQLNNTSCNGGTIPGTKRFIYSLDVTLPYASANWSFYFTGLLGTVNGTSYAAGRSSNLGNIVLNPGEYMNLEALLNNLGTPNSSPQFTTIPTPYYCMNTPQDYNQGAVDADNDSLSFALVPGITNTGVLNYITPYTPEDPLSTASGFVFNSFNGQISFTPNLSQNALVVTTVSEYRNGVLKGTSSREMSFIILSNCQNSPPSDSIDLTTLSGGMLTSDKIVNVCKGANVSFGSAITDIDGDTVNITSTPLPPGAVLNITGNNTPAPYLSFSWNTTGAALGYYTFYVTMKDNHCPLSSVQTKGFTIRVVRPFTFTSALLSPTNCAHQAYMRYDLGFGLLPRTVEIMQGTTVIKTYTDNTGVITDSLPSGNYTVNVTATDFPCPGSFNLVVPEGGIYPNLPVISSPVYYCKDDPAIQLVATPDPGAAIHWYDIQGNLLSGAPLPNTSIAGIYDFVVTQQVNVCESLKDTVTVFVTEKPTSSFVAPADFCIGDTATISYTGTAGPGSVYSWDWDGGQVISGQNAGPFRVIWTAEGTRNISLQVNQNQCLSDITSFQVLVKPTPAASFVVGNTCQTQEALVTYTGSLLAGTQFAWSFASGNPRQSQDMGPHHVVWSDTGKVNVTLVTTLNGCSDRMSREVHIYPKPEISVINQPRTLCYGDKVFLQALGTDVNSFAWYPQDKLFYEPDSAVFIRAYEPGTYMVIGSTGQGCTDSASVTFDRIEPCCTFSYPNSFTPNGDGRNDRWRVLTYGNQEDFELSIFNRWGQCVFHTFDPMASWDGTFKGLQCELETYFFYVKSRCLTGNGQENKGEIYLIR